MSSKLFGTLVATAIAGALSAGTAVAKDNKAKAPAKGDAKKAGQCVHSCKGHGKCGGNGNDNGCAGKNGCAGQGQVPEECSAAHDAKACGDVKGADGKAGLCKWKA